MSNAWRAAVCCVVLPLALVGCKSTTKTTVTTVGSPHPVGSPTSVKTKPAQTATGGDPATNATALHALAEAGVIACRKQSGSSGQCNDDPNPEISEAYPLYGFAGPSLISYSGTYFERSSTSSTTWVARWAAGPGPFSCSGSYPVPSAVLKDLGGCF
jgi:hypothetical protein